MKTVFISQKMNGLTPEEIQHKRNQIIQFIKLKEGSDIQILETYFAQNDSAQHVNEALYKLGVSIQMMAEADVAYFSKNYHLSRGCVVEHLCAESYNIPIKYHE